MKNYSLAYLAQPTFDTKLNDPRFLDPNAYDNPLKRNFQQQLLESQLFPPNANSDKDRFSMRAKSYSNQLIPMINSSQVVPSSSQINLRLPSIEEQINVLPKKFQHPQKRHYLPKQINKFNGNTKNNCIILIIESDLQTIDKVRQLFLNYDCIQVFTVFGGVNGFVEDQQSQKMFINFCNNIMMSQTINRIVLVSNALSEQLIQPQMDEIDREIRTQKHTESLMKVQLILQKTLTFHTTIDKIFINNKDIPSIIQ